MKVKKIKALSLESAAAIYKALADDSRLRILSILFHFGEICGSDLELILDFTQTKTSRHLTYLKHSGFVANTKNEKWIYYQIKEEYRDLLSTIMESIKLDEIVTKDLENYKTMYENNTLAIRQLHNKQKRYNLPEL